MRNSIPILILSILKENDLYFTEAKISSMESQLILNEIEKKIISDIKDSIYLGNNFSLAFAEEKYSYYFDTDLTFENDYLSRDSIDSAITDIRFTQLKRSLSKELLDIGGKINDLSPREIKEKLSLLHNNTLMEGKFTVPENSLANKLDPYGDLIKAKDGLSLGIHKVEQYAGKATRGSLISILAFTGSYKSTLSLNIAYENALSGYNILYLALEDTGAKIVDRLVLNHIACTANDRSRLINSNWVRDGKLTEEQKIIYNEAHNDLANKVGEHLIVWDSTDINYQTLTDMQNTLRIADKQFKDKTGKGLDAVVIDQVSLLKYTTGSGRKTSYDGQVINDWVSFFREQALNFLEDDRQIVVFMVSQTSRNSFAEASKPKKKGRYDASCSSDSHEIERSSTTMITLYKDTETNNTLLVNIPKARQGFSPDNPLQVEVYGEYYHIGPLAADISGGSITAEDFEDNDISIDDLL